jgi:alpha-beta hydrolase superfamily lysophospholipase
LKRKVILISMAILVAGGLSAAYAVYGLAAPDPTFVGDPPADLPIRKIGFEGEDGAQLRGWFVPADHARAVVVLLHGIRGNRVQMLHRARFLHAAGYAALLYDSRAHGESTGAAITFGHLESRDARKAVELARSLAGTRRTAIIAFSLGGAAAILAEPPLDADAMVLESVYPTINQAIANRLSTSAGIARTIFAPLLTAAIPLRLGFPAAELRPIDHVGNLRMPKLLIFGTADRSTTLEESLQLFVHAAEPKQKWPIDGAGHEDLDAFAGDEYREHVLRFLNESLPATLQ